MNDKDCYRMMMRETERVIAILIAAQQACEEASLQASEEEKFR